MKNIIIIMFVLLTSCVHYKVNRIGRHEQVIEVSSIYKDKERLLKYARNKAKNTRGCNWFRFTETESNKVVFICMELLPYREEYE